MTNAKHPGDETSRDDESLGKDPESIEQELFVAWQAENPAGTRQQFDEAWVTMTSATRPSNVTAPAPTSWEDDPEVLKRRMFEEWIAARPGGTREQFEAEWRALTSASGP